MKRIILMRDITLEELLEAGCHFGHQVNRRNPKADEFIFEERDNIHIINLEKTREGLLKAAEYIKSLSSTGKHLIIVGTKRQTKSIIQEEVKRAQDANTQGLFFVTSRWVGGTLTNFDEVAKNYKKLKELSKLVESGKTTTYTKRELLEFSREKAKLENLYGGIAMLDRIPDALLILDTHMETTAIAEGDAVGVTTVGIVDTNSDPASVNYPIPANDDAVGSIKVILHYLIDAWIEGSKQPKSETVEPKKEEKKVETAPEVEEKPKKTRKKKKETVKLPTV